MLSNIANRLPGFISALDNPTSIAPIFTKDMIDNCGRTVMGYNEGGIHEGREKFIDEFSTSALWLGGIPLFRKLFDLTIFKLFKLNPDIDLKKINLASDSAQAIKSGDKFIQKSLFSKKTIEYAGEEVLKNKKLYNILHASKTIVATIIPLILLVKMLNMSQNYTKKKIVNNSATPANNNKILQLNNQNKAIFASFTGQNQAVSFTGWAKFLNNFNPITLAEKAQSDTAANMLILDLGIFASRVATGRDSVQNGEKKTGVSGFFKNHAEKTERAVKEIGVIGFFYVISKWMKTGFEKLGKALNIPINLDAKILADKKLCENFCTNFSEKMTEKQIIDFIDNSQVIKNGSELKFADSVLEAARKSGLIKGKFELVNGVNKFVRNHNKFIETAKLVELNKDLAYFVESATKNPNGVEAFIKKASRTKAGFVLANMAICSFSLAYLIPKLQFFVRHKLTGSNKYPGIQGYYEEAKKQQLEKTV